MESVYKFGCHHKSFEEFDVTSTVFVLKQNWLKIHSFESKNKTLNLSKQSKNRSLRGRFDHYEIEILFNQFWFSQFRSMQTPFSICTRNTFAQKRCNCISMPIYIKNIVVARSLYTTFFKRWWWSKLVLSESGAFYGYGLKLSHAICLRIFR